MIKDATIRAHHKPAMTLELQRVREYGNTRFLPLNDLAERFLTLLGQNKFSERNIEQLKDLGLVLISIGEADEEL